MQKIKKKNREMYREKNQLQKDLHFTQEQEKQECTESINRY